MYSNYYKHEKVRHIKLIKTVISWGKLKISINLLEINSLWDLDD